MTFWLWAELQREMIFQFVQFFVITFLDKFSNPQEDFVQFFIP